MLCVAEWEAGGGRETPQTDSTAAGGGLHKVHTGQEGWTVYCGGNETGQ